MVIFILTRSPRNFTPEVRVLAGVKVCTPTSQPPDIYGLSNETLDTPVIPGIKHLRLIPRLLYVTRSATRLRITATKAQSIFHPVSCGVCDARTRKIIEIIRASVLLRGPPLYFAGAIMIHLARNAVSVVFVVCPGTANVSFLIRVFCRAATGSVTRGIRSFFVVVNCTQLVVNDNCADVGAIMTP